MARRTRRTVGKRTARTTYRAPVRKTRRRVAKKAAAKKAARRQAAIKRVKARKPAAPPTPAIVSEPPTPTITSVSHETFRLGQIQPGYGPASEHEAFRMEAGDRGTPVPKALAGTQPGRWVTAAGETGLKPATQPSRWMAAAEGKTGLRPGSQVGRWLAAAEGKVGLGVGPSQASRWLAAAGGLPAAQGPYAQVRARREGGFRTGTYTPTYEGGGGLPRKTYAEAFLRGPGRFTPYVIEQPPTTGGYYDSGGGARYYGGGGGGGAARATGRYGLGMVSWRI